MLVPQMAETKRTPVDAVVKILSTAKGGVQVRVHVLGRSDIDPTRLKNYALFAWSSLEAHGFKDWELDIRNAIWHPDRKEYLFDTTFQWSDNAEKDGAWIMLITLNIKSGVLERLPKLAKALMLPMSHGNVVFTPKLRTNIKGWKVAKAR